MDLRRLEYFVAVAEELHFGRAADRLHMAQPPLSQQIRRLESELGLTLFDRSTRRVALTPAGDLLLVHARQVLGRAAAADRAMAEFRSGERGTLRIGFVDSAAYQFMPELLHEYRNRWPDVDYELSSMSSDEQYDALLGADIDLGICRTVARPDDVRTTTFVQEPLCLAVGSSHRLAGQRSTSLSQLRSDNFIGFDRAVSPSLHDELVTMFQGHGVRYDPFIEATEYATILGLVAASEGVAVVPAGVQTLQPPNLRYVRFRNAEAVLPLLLMTRADESLRLVAHAFSLVAEMYSLPTGART